MKTVALLYGGKSGEHDVSCVSAASVYANLDPLRYSIIQIGIDREGVWYLQNRKEDTKNIKESAGTTDGNPRITMPSLGPVRTGRKVFVSPGNGLVETAADGTLRPISCDIVFPVLHGTFGEDGTVQGLLECANIPYVGAGVLGSAIGMDKDVAKQLWLEADLPVVDSIAVRMAEFSGSSSLANLKRKISARFGWPCFVKPAASGSSVGTTKVSDPETLEAALVEASMWSEKVLVERFVEAREIECAVLGNDAPLAFLPGEIVPRHEFYDFSAKYEDPNGARLIVPADFSSALSDRIREIAVLAFKICELSGMARVDFFLDKHTGEILLNEVNTIPGFTAISMYPRLCENAGIQYSELLNRLIELGFDRFSRKSALQYRYEG
jgi:D-alanine-D-alanine ligase